MDLLAVRKKVVELSGKYDLVQDTKDWKDAGANFYINAAQEFLDRRSNVSKKTSRLFYELAAGDWYQTFQKCRIIEEVFISNAEGRSRLEKKDFLWLHEKYSGLISAQTTGTPKYFCPAKLRSDEDTDMDNLGAFFNYVMDDQDAYRGVLIFPPPDEAIVLEVIGQFYASELTDDDDESFWTIMHPGVLILGTLYQIEALAHRNTEGSKDYLMQLDIALADIDKDIAEEDSYGTNQIEG